MPQVAVTAIRSPAVTLIVQAIMGLGAKACRRPSSIRLGRGTLIAMVGREHPLPTLCYGELCQDYVKMGE